MTQDRGRGTVAPHADRPAASPSSPAAAAERGTWRRAGEANVSGLPTF
jgi:hypothetical protein